MLIGRPQVRLLRFRRRHPRSEAFSRYLDDDLDQSERRTFEAHVKQCPRCRRVLASLTDLVDALGSLQTPSPRGLADTIVSALRAEAPAELAARGRGRGSSGAAPRTVVLSVDQQSRGEQRLRRWPHEAHRAVRWCLKWPQLRITAPITVGAGLVLSLVNMGGMIMAGRFDLRVCVSCTIDFLVPFLVLNLGLLLLLRLPGRRRV